LYILCTVASQSELLSDSLSELRCNKYAKVVASCLTLQNYQIWRPGIWSQNRPGIWTRNQEFELKNSSTRGKCVYISKLFGI